MVEEDIYVRFGKQGSYLSVGCNYVADTRDGFEDNPLDTKWVAEYFMPKAKEYGCSIIYFIIDKENSFEKREG